MFETGGSNDDGWGDNPPPPAADRLWRHPSEVAAARPVASPLSVATSDRSTSRTQRGHRFSLGTVVVAGSLGALAMFGTLAAMGLISGTAPSASTDEATATLTSGTVAAHPGLTTTVPDGVVSVRLTSAVATTFGAGLVINAAGDVVTTLRATGPDGTPAGSISIEAGGTTWTSATVVGTDPATGLTVLEPAPTRSSARSASNSSTASSAAVASPSLGQNVAMVRPGPAAVGARYSGATTTRITSINACVTDAQASFVGLLTLTSSRPTGETEIAVDPASGAVTALVLPVDDNLEDEMAYAVPADLALGVGRQIAVHGRAEHGRLDAVLAAVTDDVVVVAGTISTGSTSLRVGDELLSIDGRPVHNVNDVTGALLGSTSGDTVSVVVRRDNRRQPLEAVVVPMDGPAASTTTLP